MSARKRCKTCGGDIAEWLVAGHLVFKHLVTPKVWHKPEPR